MHPLSKMSYTTFYEMSETQLQNMTTDQREKFIREQLEKRFTGAITHKIPIKKLARPDRLSTVFSIEFCLATQEEFWQCVRDEATKMKEYEKQLTAESE